MFCDRHARKIWPSDRTTTPPPPFLSARAMMMAFWPESQANIYHVEVRMGVAMAILDGNVGAVSSAFPVPFRAGCPQNAD